MIDLQRTRLSTLLSVPLLLAPSLVRLLTICRAFDLRLWWAPVAIAIATFGFAATVEMKWRRAPGAWLLGSMAAGFALSAVVSVYFVPLTCCAGPIR